MHLCNITTVCLWYCSECARNYEYQIMVKLIIYTVHTSKCSSQHALPWYPTVGPFLWARAHHSFRLFLGHWEADERSIWGVDCGFSTFRNKTHVIFFSPFVHYLAKNHKKIRLTTKNRKKMPPKAIHALFLPKIHGNVDSADPGHDSMLNCDVTDLSDQSLTYNFQHS